MCEKVKICQYRTVNVTRLRELMSRMSKIFNFEIFTPLSGSLKMLHLDANHIGYLVTEL